MGETDIQAGERWVGRENGRVRGGGEGRQKKKQSHRLTNSQRAGETCRQTDTERQTETISNLMLYAQSASTVISGWKRDRGRQTHKQRERSGHMQTDIDTEMEKFI